MMKKPKNIVNQIMLRVITLGILLLLGYFILAPLYPDDHSKKFTISRAYKNLSLYSEQIDSILAINKTPIFTKYVQKQNSKINQLVNIFLYAT